MLKKNYDNASSQNEVIAKNIRAFRKSSEKFKSESKMAAVRRSLCLMITIFTQKQLLILQILSCCENILHNSYKDGYIYSPELVVTLLQVFPNLIPRVHVYVIYLNKICLN